MSKRPEFPVIVLRPPKRRETSRYLLFIRAEWFGSPHVVSVDDLEPVGDGGWTARRMLPTGEREIVLTFSAALPFMMAERSAFQFLSGKQFDKIFKKKRPESDLGGTLPLALASPGEAAWPGQYA